MLTRLEQVYPCPSALTKQDVIKLCKANVSSVVIIARIKNSASYFDLSAEEILELKNEGVPEKVIKAMIEARPKPLLDSPPEPFFGYDPYRGWRFYRYYYRD